MSLRIGTRESALAQAQAEWVASQLKDIGVETTIVPITTYGDQHQGPIASVEGEGIFTKEIQRELLDDRVDIGVHSLKDLLTSEPPGLMLAVVPPRAPADDVLICRRHESFEELPAGVVVGTSSTRRRAQLLRLRPDLHVKDIRGNVPTRLRKLDHGEYDALILAEAGLQRLGLGDRITQRMPFPMFLPAVGQGALGLEVRAGDQGVMTQIAPLDDSDTHLAVLAERAMLASLHGGCLAPVAGYAHVDHHRLILVGRVLSHDGSELLEASLVESLSVAAPDVSNGNRETAKTLGRRVADALLSQGAAKLIQAARRV